MVAEYFKQVVKQETNVIEGLKEFLKESGTSIEQIESLNKQQLWFKKKSLTAEE